MKIYDYALSDKNIYLAIYCLDSYIFNPELLSHEDRKLLDQLRDKFNEQIIKETVKIVKARIKELLMNPDEFINAEVYFKPKKVQDDDIIFRPLHVAGIIEQLAIVALLNVFIYEIPNEDNKLVLSNFSRLIPSNFFGNRVSVKPEELFKPWNEQYKEYTQQANEKFEQYYESKEYSHEVKLDLQNFFPSVSPVILYNYIMDKMPVSIIGEDRKTIEIILVKLLISKIINLKSKKELEKYYGETFGFEGPYFTLGIAQGLPQSYFLGNICMIEIARVFDTVFEGVSLYYVDDSVLFTRGITKTIFEERLEEINRKIEEGFRRYKETPENSLRLYNEELSSFLNNTDIYYGIRVHNQGDKSTFTEIATASQGEIYLKCLSREVSKTAFDMYSTYSDEEDLIIRNRIKTLVTAINKEKTIIEDKISQTNDIVEVEKLENYRDKLIRYYKYFEYRKIKINLRTDENIEDAERIVYHARISGNKISKDTFIKDYKEGIWEVALSILLKYTRDKKRRQKLRNYLITINETIFKFTNKTSSYLYKANQYFIEGKDEYVFTTCKYDSLEEKVKKNLATFDKKHTQYIIRYIQEKLIPKENTKILLDSELLSADFKEMISLVDANTNELQRMMLNAQFSQALNYEISDNFILAKRVKKPILYGELRVLIFLRNRYCNIERFLDRKFDLTQDQNLQKIDYSIFEVLDCFKSYIKQPDLIDNLVLIHQYTCDVWKNGSKFLYFYTLHNQEHAVDLIKNIIKIEKAIDYIQISSNDYYILFIACYLHDISMVKIPSADTFLLNTDEADRICFKFMDNVKDYLAKKRDTNEFKCLLHEYYRHIDQFYETNIRSSHALDSAKEIRTRSDLDFLEQCLRETIAQVSEGHGQRAEDVYNIQSNAKNSLVSLKFNKILLRLADLLDMSCYRVSRPILNHNIEQMSSESAFHWISHMITEKYELETEYELKKEDTSGSYLDPDSIIENVNLHIYVDISQLSKVPNKFKCKKVRINTSSLTDEGFELICGEKCEDGECNFLCKWFVTKNWYLVEELVALKEYLDRNSGTFYESNFKITLHIKNKTCLEPRQFEIIKKKIS